MRARRARDLITAAAVCLCLLRFASFEIASTPIFWDARYYTFFASRVAQGDVPYRDFFENKTPLSIFAGALLHELGSAAGLEPLHAVRAGFLALAALGGLALFAVHRRLARGRLVPGLLALAVYCGFPLLGWLPAIGVLPKALMGLCASLAALAVARGRFALAGAAGGLAFLDWQIGALVVLGALAGALARRRGERGRAVASVLAGAAAACAPLVIYLAARGALGLAWAQTIGTLFARGAQSASADPLLRLAHILANVGQGCAGHVWLFYAGVLGLAVLPVWLWRRRRSADLGVGLCLAVYHYGVVAFSLLDYQSFGDLYILLHSIAFFAALAFAELLRALVLLLPRQRTRLELGGLALLTGALAPFYLSTAPLLGPTVRPETTLADQKQAAGALERLAGRRVAVVGPAELLYLREQANGVPFVYWNTVTHGYYRRGPREAYLRTLDRLLEAHAASWIVVDRTVPPEPGDERLASANGSYWVVLRPVRRSKD